MTVQESRPGANSADHMQNLPQGKIPLPAATEQFRILPSIPGYRTEIGSMPLGPVTHNLLEHVRKNSHFIFGIQIEFCSTIPASDNYIFIGPALSDFSLCPLARIIHKALQRGGVGGYGCKACNRKPRRRA